MAKEREIWWISFGDNVGFEINGKNKLFARPGLILKKLTTGFFLVAPTTSQFRRGSWYKEVDCFNKRMTICLHQIRVVDYRRFLNILGRLSEKDFQDVKEVFWELYK